MIYTMIDLETLDVEPSAVVLSLGAVKFNPLLDHIPADAPKLEILIDIDEQSTKLGRTISDSTLEWWGKQSPAAQERAFTENGRISVDEAVDKIHRFVWNSDRVWSQGSFDINILEHLFKQVNKPIPWKYYQIRDSRTLFDIVGGKGNNSLEHSALDDAISQADGLVKSLKALGWSGNPIQLPPMQ